MNRELFSYFFFIFIIIFAAFEADEHLPLLVRKHLQATDVSGSWKGTRTDLNVVQ